MILQAQARYRTGGVYDFENRECETPRAAEEFRKDFEARFAGWTIVVLDAGAPAAMKFPPLVDMDGAS